MEQAFVVFINAYETAGRNPAKMDLATLKEQLGGKMDLYIINADGIIEYTTYLSDLGLDFKKWPDFFETLTTYRQSNQFISGHFALEARTGIFRKFSYFPTPDLKYLLELGLKTDEFADLMVGLDLLEITD
jgi:two-component system sensor histidine kinase ChiS